MYNVKDMVKDGKRVRFVKYRKGELIYVTECDFEFPVPIDDTGDGVFLAEDKAMLFMRYIRKQIDAINKERASILQAEIDNKIIKDVETTAGGFRHHLFPNLIFVEDFSPEFREKLDQLTDEDLEAMISKFGHNAVAAGKAVLSAFGEKSE